MYHLFLILLREIWLRDFGIYFQRCLSWEEGLHSRKGYLSSAAYLRTSSRSQLFLQLKRMHAYIHSSCLWCFSADSIVWKTCCKQPKEAWETSEACLTLKADNIWQNFALCFFLHVKATFAPSCVKPNFYPSNNCSRASLRFWLLFSYLHIF